MQQYSFNKSSPKSFGRAASPSLMTENGLAHCVCLFTVDESNRSATGTLHPYRTNGHTTTVYAALA